VSNAACRTCYVFLFASRPFKVAQKNGKPAITVSYRGEKRDFTPEEISAMVLTKMKETAEAYLGKKVTHAVVTVPACKHHCFVAITRVLTLML
jgi:molecular chaperone DnaK (HSP70)